MTSTRIWYSLLFTKWRNNYKQTKTKIITEDIDLADKKGILVIPGGQSTRKLVNDESFLKILKVMAKRSEIYLSICTESALLAKVSVLDEKSVTSNKQEFEWVKSINDNVNWIQKANKIVHSIEYVWNSDSKNDLFSK